MEPLIRALLRTLVGEKEANQIQIVSNQVNIKPSGEWNIVFHDNSHFGMFALYYTADWYKDMTNH